MFKRFVSCALLISILALSFCSCAAQKEQQAAALNKYTYNFLNCFDTVSTVVGYDKNEETFKKNCEFIEAELTSYNNLYDIYKDYAGINNIRTINKNAGKEPVKVDEKIIDLLEYCVELYTLTGGKTNVAMGSVLSIWHDFRELYSENSADAILPPMDMLKKAAEHININDVIIDRENSTVFLKDKEMTLDVGAVAKGYATEQVAKALEAKGITSYTLNIGGNIRTIGPKGDGTPWTTSVTKTEIAFDGEKALRVELNDHAFVTSGNYNRYYVVDGKTYHHIIDPDTLMPKFDFISVSICCKDSGLADALSTATFNMSFEEGKALINSLDDVEAVWLTADGKLLYSDNFEKIVLED